MCASSSEDAFGHNSLAETGHKLHKQLAVVMIWVRLLSLTFHTCDLQCLNAYFLWHGKLAVVSRRIVPAQSKNIRIWLGRDTSITHSLVLRPFCILVPGGRGGRDSHPRQTLLRFVSGVGGAGGRDSSPAHPGNETQKGLGTKLHDITHHCLISMIIRFLSYML